MKWGWRRIDDNNWHYDASWAVTRHWATQRWYVVRDGKHLLVDHATAQAAIEEAEELMRGEQ
jgi:hypothetical protein